VETLTGRYRLIERLGSGGMSVVWRAYDEVLGRQVAVKVLAAEFAADADFRARLRQEARAVARMSHPHVTNVYDYGETGDGLPFVVMELVEGESLAHRLDRGRLHWPAVVEIGAQIAAALATAHERGLVHQDIKPANVMLCATGAKLVDFGISAIAGTQRLEVLGTPGYLAPEQRAGEPATPATDVYALGLLLSRSLDERQGVPPGLHELIAECVREDPASRPPSFRVAERLAELRASALKAPAQSGRAFVVGRTPVLAPEPARTHGTRVMPVPPPPPPPRRASRWPLIAGLTVLAVIACLIGLALINGHAKPSATATQSPAAPPPPRPSPRLACLVDFQLSDYRIGYSANLRVTNTGADTINGWSLVFDLPDNMSFGGGVGGIWTQDGKHLTAKDWFVNSSIKPGSSVSLTLFGTTKGKADSPKKFTLNNVACRAGAS
jgi:serine/threonine-protein kinase